MVHKLIEGKIVRRENLDTAQGRVSGRDGVPRQRRSAPSAVPTLERTAVGAVARGRPDVRRLAVAAEAATPATSRTPF